MMKEKILYLSHIDWNWIKQRPQFIAEELKEYFDIAVLYMFQNSKRKALQKRSYKGEAVSPIFSIPFAGRIKPIGLLNNIFLTAQMKLYINRVKPKYVYFTFPSQIDILPKNYSGRVIYDCMDDHIAMACSNRKERLIEQEQRMLDRANVVLVSSENLKKQLLTRYGHQHDSKINLVRNGYNGEILSVLPKEVAPCSKFTLSYIGTVGKWFNFEYIMKSIEDIPQINYKIIGPIDTDVPNSERIEYVGTLEHDELYNAIKNTDGLIMPFVVNDIVASVDPVKLYEYINFNMNILCVKYDEIERFSPFVHFYTDYASYKEQIEAMIEDNTLLYNKELRNSFLTENNWSARAKAIYEIIHE